MLCLGAGAPASGRGGSEVATQVGWKILDPRSTDPAGSVALALPAWRMGGLPQPGESEHTTLVVRCVERRAEAHLAKVRIVPPVPSALTLPTPSGQPVWEAGRERPIVLRFDGSEARRVHALYPPPPTDEVVLPDPEAVISGLLEHRVLELFMLEQVANFSLPAERLIAGQVPTATFRLAGLAEKLRETGDPCGWMQARSERVKGRRR